MIKHPCLLPISSCWQSSKERANPSQACSQELFPACITNKIVFNWNRGVSSWMNAYVVQLVETLCVLPPLLWLRFAMVCTSSYILPPSCTLHPHTHSPPTSHLLPVWWVCQWLSKVRTWWEERSREEGSPALWHTVGICVCV